MLDWNIENKFDGTVCGVDEAGRGPWIGPVVAGAVIFKSREINPELLVNINDSKKLSAAKREHLYELLLNEADIGNLIYGIGEAGPQEIDELNILQATFSAMRRAVEKLEIIPDIALIDGNRTPQNFPCASQCIIGGDGLCYSIAAASIIAKVHRDRLMQQMALEYPQYCLEKNAGYGTKEHIMAIEKYGITPQHRKSYKPIKEYLLKQSLK